MARFGSKLIHVMDGGESFVIMNESTGNEIELNKDEALWVVQTIGNFIGVFASEDPF